MIAGTPLISLAQGLTADVLHQALQARLAASERAPKPIAKASNAYVLAASVLHVFDPATIKPFGDADPKDRLILDALSTPAIGWRDRRLRMLQASARIDALQRLGSREIMRSALDANPGRERSAVQALFEQWLTASLEPESLGAAGLEELRQLYDWGLEHMGGLPSRAAFDQLRARKARTAIFEDLVDKSFTGRDRELQRLRDYVGVVPPTLWQRARAFVHGGGPAPLVVHGPGGMGKTALLGAFLMDHVERSNDAWFPFAYLAFDNEVLDVREPWTLLAAASEQICAQIVPAESDAADDVRSVIESFRWTLGEFRAERATSIWRAQNIQSQSGRVNLTLAANNRLYREFAALLRAASHTSEQRQTANAVPVVLILDTFEEVLYRANEDLLGLWDMLSVLQRECKLLRIIVSSRVMPRLFEINGHPPDTLTLGDLAEADAITVLERLGVKDEAACRAIVRQVGGSPLSLRLAARAAKSEAVGEQGFSDLQTHRLWLVRLSPELIRGQLYRRILGHIHDPDVAQLAHPGMVLRRVTPEIIERLLAPACRLAGITPERARDLFHELQREHALVRLADDASLRYRDEVRGPMLQLLVADRPDDVTALHQAAVTYYGAARFTEPLERAEELYHRLMLDQSSEELQGRWVPGAERFLGSAINEIPPEKRIWLAQHMSIELSPDLLAQAEQAEWERVVGYRALELVRHDLPQAVIDLLSERSVRMADSPLFAIQIRCLGSLGRYVDALALAEQAAGAWPMHGSAARLAEVLWLGAQAARSIGMVTEAVALLRLAAERTAALPDRIPRLQILTELVALAPEEAFRLRTNLADALDALKPEDVDRERSLVRLACVRLGPDYPSSIWRVIPMVLSDFAERVLRYDIAIDLLIPRILAALQSSDEAIQALGTLFQPNLWSQKLFVELLERLARLGTAAALPALLIAMSAERGDLAASTLGGIDSYREDFEMRAAPEALA